jgi:hypothetical protein
MADDASYNTFLAKANADPSATPADTTSKTQSTSQAKSKLDPSVQPNASVPPSIQAIVSNYEYTYTSDTDSQFEPVFFSYSGEGKPSVEDFEKCLEHDEHKDVKGKGKVEELSTSEWDSRGTYGKVVDAVAQVGEGGKGKVQIFRVETGATRVEYFVVTVWGGKKEMGRKIVGVKVRAVES